MNASLRTILITTIAATALGSAHATEPGAGSEATSGAAGSKYDLKNKSTFTLAAARRAPFWPIGWVKRKNETRTEITQAPKAKLDENAFTVTSIMLGNPSLAVLNGRAYSEGEFIRMPKGGAPMKVRVQQIGDGTVSLSYEQQVFVVTLKRPELAQHRTEDVLDPDR